MGLFSKLKDPKATPRASGEYIDLEEYVTETGAAPAASDRDGTMFVRVAEIHKYDELRELANYVYKGNMLFLDFGPIAQDDVILKRVTGELKKLVTDIGGDIAGLGKTTLIVTPTGVKIDRTKVRVKA
ncbi:MAG: cell division protein SepF, partial [Euryarchaeota archaeon]|nr:cell division protein SepF [Euryarchaeota archaeon]